MAEIDASWRGDKVSYRPPKLKLLPRRDIGDWAPTLLACSIRRVSYCSRYASLLHEKVGANCLRAASRMKIKRKICDKYKIRRIFLSFFKTAVIQNGGSVGGPIVYISTGKQFQFWRSVRNLVSSPRRIYFCHKIGVCF